METVGKMGGGAAAHELSRAPVEALATVVHTHGCFLSGKSSREMGNAGWSNLIHLWEITKTKVTSRQGAMCPVHAPQGTAGRISPEDHLLNTPRDLGCGCLPVNLHDHGLLQSVKWTSRSSAKATVLPGDEMARYQLKTSCIGALRKNLA